LFLLLIHNSYPTQHTIDLESDVDSPLTQAKTAEQDLRLRAANRIRHIDANAKPSLIIDPISDDLEHVLEETAAITCLINWLRL
jgi:hypothetical protein